MQMMKWKTVTIFLVLAFVVSTLAGCGGGQKTSSSGPWTGTITIWDAPRWPDANDDKYHWIKAKIAEFEKLNPGVKIELVQVPWKELPDKLSVAIAGKAWPDIAPVDVSGGGVKLSDIEQGVVEALDSFFTKEELDDFYPAAKEAYTYKGKLYGIPTSMSVHALMLNLDIFKERGVEPPKDGKWTYEEFVETLKKLTFDRVKDGKTTKVYGFSTYILKNYYEAWPFLYMDGGRPLSPDGKEYTFDSPEAISGLKKLADLKFVYKVTPPDMGGSDVGGTFKAFAAPDQRTVAIEPWNSWAIATLRNHKTYKMNFMVAEYPTGKTGKPVTISGAGGWVVFAQKDKAKLNMVVKFAKFLSKTEEQVTFAKNYGTFPALKSAAKADPFADNPQMKRAQAMLEHAVTIPKVANWSQIDDRIQAQLQLVFNGEKTPEQALKDARKEVEDFLKK